jgi:rod shape-determining protein MreC
MIGRRRIVFLLLLTALLLLTLDLRGVTGLNLIRSGFVQVMSPVETATRVVTRPLVDAGRAIAGFDDLREQNRRLQEQIDAQRGNEIAARNAIIENQQLRALNALESLTDIPSVTAGIIGESPSNIDQIVEIDRGRRQGIQVGMAVANEAGLIGKVTAVFENSSLVMLMTDARYAVEVKVVAREVEDPASQPAVTVPSGLSLDELEEAASAPAPSTDQDVDFGDLTAGELDALTRFALVDAGATASEIAELEALASADETTLAELVGSLAGPELAIRVAQEILEGRTAGDPVDVPREDPDEGVLRETGALRGQGSGRLPQVNFVVSTRSLAELQIGDYVLTAGGRSSLAPPDIPVGTVVNIITSAGSAGSQLEILPAADLSSLRFVRILLYKPSVEISR